MIYRTETIELPGSNFRFQIVFNSENQSYQCILYKSSGSKVKHSDLSDTEQGTIENMQVFIHEMDQKIR